MIHTNMFTLRRSMFFPLDRDLDDFPPAICHAAELPLRADDELISLLNQAAESELDGLVKCFMNRGGITCQLKGLPVYKTYSPHHRNYVNDIAAELQKYGANSLTSHAFRSGKGVLYREIVEDVAGRLSVGRKGSTEEVEKRIYEKLGKDYWEKAGPEQRLALLRQVGVRDDSLVTQPMLPAAVIGLIHVSGFAAYQFTVVVANAVAHALIGHGLSLVVNAALTKSLSLFAGPPGWCLAGLLSANSIAGEAYRVTVPAVVQVSMIRSRVEAKRQQKTARLKTVLAVLFVAGLGASIVLIRWWL